MIHSDHYFIGLQGLYDIWVRVKNYVS